MKELCLAHAYILFHPQQQPALRGSIALLVLLSLAVSPAAAEKEQLTQAVTQAEGRPAAVLWGHRRHLSSVSPFLLHPPQCWPHKQMAELQRTTLTPTYSPHQVPPKCSNAHTAVQPTKAAHSAKDVGQSQQGTMSLVTDNVHLIARVAAANIS